VSQVATTFDLVPRRGGVLEQPTKIKADNIENISL
jgi:hypothetical protein